MERGYSLLEILVVLAIIGLIAAVAVVPIGTTIDAMRLADDARSFAQSLKDMREKALDEQREITIAVDPRDGRLTLVGGSHFTLPVDSDVVMLSQPNAPREFAFRSDGTTTSGTFQLSRGQATARVIVDEISGAIEVAR